MTSLRKKKPDESEKISSLYEFNKDNDAIDNKRIGNKILKNYPE